MRVRRRVGERKPVLIILHFRTMSHIDFALTQLKTPWSSLRLLTNASVTMKPTSPPNLLHHFSAVQILGILEIPNRLRHPRHHPSITIPLDDVIRGKVRAIPFAPAHSSPINLTQRPQLPNLREFTSPNPRPRLPVKVAKDATHKAMHSNYTRGDYRGPTRTALIRSLRSQRFPTWITTYMITIIRRYLNHIERSSSRFSLQISNLGNRLI